ncbi:MAG: ribosome biogenesis GTPase Der [Gammaproteobacteria bacterium]|nr:ribosome biogenesis GTPase Der [Gammaproteobacteria bacterium]
MSNVVALVGRPNVGKSTLFNRLTRSRDALVADVPGVTRDRKYGYAHFGDASFVVVDTGGLNDERSDIGSATVRQANEAVDEAQLVVLVLDAQAGLTAADELIATGLRKRDKPLLAAVNKVDGLDERTATSEFFTLGIETLAPIVATQGRGVQRLADAIVANLPTADRAAPPDAGIRIAVVGRPNAGKSTLINRLLGEERVIAAAAPGTTRDSVYVPFEHKGDSFTLIDTAGVRRRARVTHAVEKFSVVQTLDAVEASNVVVLMLDASEGVAEHDVHLIGYVLDAGRGLVIAVNKWDALDDYARKRVREELDRRLKFIGACETHFVSAKEGRGVTALLRAARRAHRAATREFATSELTALLERALAKHPPPLVRGRPIKLRYAHQGGRNPPVIVVHGNQTERVPDTYVRYLANFFADELQLRGTPLRVTFRSTANPFAGRRNQLTRRQQMKRRRLIRHRK